MAWLSVKVGIEGEFSFVWAPILSEGLGLCIPDLPGFSVGQGIKLFNDEELRNSTRLAWWPTDFPYPPPYS